MLTPINTSNVPSGGWSVTLEGAGPTIVSNHFTVFMQEVSTRLKSNGLDRHGWRQAVLDLMCHQRPDIPSEDLDAPPVRSFTGDDVARFLRTMIETKLQGAQPVSDDLQDSRIETCLACPKRGHIACSMGCGIISETLAQFAIGRKIRRHADIHKQSCTACGCYCEVKTMWPLDILKGVDERSGTKPEYAPGCWMLSEPHSSPQPPPAAT
jgi:hypothetical protein